MNRLVLLTFVASLVASNPIDNDQDLLEDPNLFEGDILLPYDKEDRSSVFEKKRWTNGVIPYELAPAIEPYESNVREIMDYIGKATCVTFRKKTPEDTNHIYIFNGKGCYSYIGMIGRRQQLSLKVPGCMDKGVILHELTHAIGFHHEHSRHDRDEFVDIHWENVREEFQNQFRKLGKNEAATFNSFDYQSIMLYGETVFSKDARAGLKTMTPKKPGVTLPGVYGRSKYSESDLYRIEQMYGKCH